MSAESKLRTLDEVQRAHDLLVGVILGDAKVDIADRTAKQIRVAASVLCWVLHHDHNEVFAENLRLVEDACREAGFKLCRMGGEFCEQAFKSPVMGGVPAFNLSWRRLAEKGVCDEIYGREYHRVLAKWLLGGMIGDVVGFISLEANIGAPYPEVEKQGDSH